MKELLQSGFQMTGDISWLTVLLTIAMSFIVGCFVYFIYKHTFAGVVFTKNFGMSLVLMCMVTGILLMTISSNIALTLGMVGALSIVRFRTAVKDPIDTMFMFWEIAEGILIGIGFYLAAIIAAVCIGALMVVLSMFHFKKNKPYILVLRFETSAKQEVQRLLARFPEGKLKSKTVSRGVIELTIEMNVTSQEIGLMEKFVDIPGVYDASLISYNGDVVA